MSFNYGTFFKPAWYNTITSELVRTNLDKVDLYFNKDMSFDRRRKSYKKLLSLKPKQPGTWIVSTSIAMDTKHE